MPDSIRWRLLSTATINTALIDPIQKSARSELYAVASRDQAKAQAYAREKGIAHAYGSYEAMLADPAVDAVYISLPNSLHCEWAVRAAEAGKHILCQKPLALTLADCDRIIEVVRQTGIKFMMAYQMRRDPSNIVGIPTPAGLHPAPTSASCQASPPLPVPSR